MLTADGADMIQPIYVVRPSHPVAAITLLVIAFITGYAFGLAGGMVWNKRA
jgi:hypothetical protein